MVDAALVEVLAEVLCATSAVLFTFIATFSRSPTAENIVQNIIFVLLLAAAAVLW